MLPVDALSASLLYALGGASIRAVLLGVAAVVLIRALRLRAAPMQHAVWVSVVGAMLVLPFVAAVVPALRVVPEIGSFALPAAVEPSFPVTRVQRAEPITIQVDGSGLVTNYGSGAVRPVVGWISVLAGVYLAGVLARLLRMGVGLWLGGRLVGRAATLRGTRANALAEDVAGEIGMGFPWPTVCESDEVSVPVVVGGDVVLPAGWDRWEDGKLRAVLVHELMHVRRGDPAVLLLAGVNTAVFWFHPLAWWLQRRLADLCELACDDAAVIADGEASRYAQVVLDLAGEANSRGGRLLTGALVAPSIAGPRGVSRRIHRLLEETSWSSGLVSRGRWLAVLGVAVPVLGLLSAAQVSSPAAARLVPGDVGPGWPWQQEGFKTTAEEAAALEEKLVREPEDLAARARLIAYYLYHMKSDALGTHVKWVIEHHPESELAGSAAVAGDYLSAIRPPAEADVQERAQLWRQQAALHPSNARVLGHAAQGMVRADPLESERLALRARELAPKESRWTLYLANLYSSAVRAQLFQRAGVPLYPFQKPLDGNWTQIADNVNRLQDAELAGHVGAALAQSVTNVFESRAGYEAQLTEARRAVSEYARGLLKRGLAARPGQVEWTQALARLDGGIPPVGAVPPQVTPRILQKTAEDYPALAKQARIQGVVRLRVRIGADGQVQHITVVHGHPLLVPSAVASMKSSKHTPTGSEVETTVDVNFTLPRE